MGRLISSEYMACISLKMGLDHTFAIISVCYKVYTLHHACYDTPKSIQGSI